MSAVAPHKSLAVVLHGRMGGMASLMLGAPGRPLRSFDGAVASPSSAALCAASLEQHVIGPNRAHFAVDVFGHSWSPEIGATLDGLFAPRRSLHEEGISKANFRCPDPNSRRKHADGSTTLSSSPAGTSCGARRSSSSVRCRAGTPTARGVGGPYGYRASASPSTVAIGRARPSAQPYAAAARARGSHRRLRASAPAPRVRASRT